MLNNGSPESPGFTVVVAIQHQRLAEEERRLASADGRARQLELRVQRRHGALSEQYGFGRILGEAPSLREALERAARVAPEESPVLDRRERHGQGPVLAWKSY